jgi:hypothetical protein
MIDLESVGDATLVVAIAHWHEPALAEAYPRRGARSSRWAHRFRLGLGRLRSALGREGALT